MEHLLIIGIVNKAKKEWGRRELKKTEQENP